MTGLDYNNFITMKILYFINGLNYKGGMARIVVDKANYLADNFKHDVTICVANNIESSAYALSSNVKICKIGGGNEQNANVFKKTIGVIACFKKLSKLLRKIQPDIVVNAQTQIVTWHCLLSVKIFRRLWKFIFHISGWNTTLRIKALCLRIYIFHLPHIFTSVMTVLLFLPKKTSLIGKA